MGLKIIFFLGVFLVFAAASVLANPLMGLLGYMYVYLGLSASTWWGSTLLGLPIRYSFLMTLCIVAGFFLQRRKLAWIESESRGRERLLWIFFGVIALSFLAASIKPYDAQFTFTKMMKVGIFLFFFIKIVTSLDNFRWIIRGLCVFGLLVGLNAYNAPEWMFASGRLDYLGNSDYANANSLGSLLAVILCFAGLQVFQEKVWSKRFLWIICAAFVCNGIILAKSRGVFIAIVCTAFIAFFAAQRFPKKLKRNILFGLILGVGLFFYLSDTSFLTRVTAFDQYGEDASSANRLNIWSASVPMLLDHPLGVGVGNFKEYIGEYNSNVMGRDAHNTIVRCYGELGVLGLLVFLGLYFGAFKQLRRIRKKISDTPIEFEVNLYTFAIFCALLVSFISGLFTTVLYVEFFWWLLILPICLERSVDLELQTLKCCKEEPGVYAHVV